MSDHNRSQQDMLNKVSRRYLLRNSAIAATGAVLLPSFITGCGKDNDAPANPPGPVIVGGVEYTQDDLEAAAANLKRLKAFLVELFPLQVAYELAVFQSLNSSTGNDKWTNFIVDIFIDVAIGILATGAAVSGGAAFIPTIAGLSSVLHDWGIGKDSPPFNVGDIEAEYAFAHEHLESAMEDRLDLLTNADNNYQNLVNAWKDNIEFNGQTYTLGDLASTHFPASDEDGYVDLKDAAEDYYHRSLWNLVIIKCCEYYENYHTEVELYQGDTPVSATDYARQTFYPQNPGVYVRGEPSTNYPDQGFRVVELVYWNLGIGGDPLPPSACQELFKDDTPGHAPDAACSCASSIGLFNRDYVFKQFTTKKPDFLRNYMELGTTLQADFSGDDDWEFTAGLFPKLIQG